MRWINSKIFTVVGSFLLAWMFFAVVYIEVEKKDVKKEERVIESKLDEVELNNESLEKFIKNMNDPVFIEKQARLRLNYKLSGEEAVFIYRDTEEHGASLSEGLQSEEVFKKWTVNLQKIFFWSR